MSAENAQSFLKIVNEDAALKAQVKDIKGEEDAVLAEIVKVGVAKNLAFTADELNAAAQSCQGKMSDQDLDKVAGGGCSVILLTVGCCTG